MSWQSCNKRRTFRRHLMKSWAWVFAVGCHRGRHWFSSSSHPPWAQALAGITWPMPPKKWGGSSRMLGETNFGMRNPSSLWLWKPRPQKQLIKSLDPISKSKREVSTQCHLVKQNSFQDLGPLMSTMVHVRGRTSSWWLGLLPAPFTQVIHGGMIAKCPKKLIQSPINGDTHFCCYFIECCKTWQELNQIYNLAVPLHCIHIYIYVYIYIHLCVYK